VLRLDREAGRNAANGLVVVRRNREASEAVTVAALTDKLKLLPNGEARGDSADLLIGQAKNCLTVDRLDLGRGRVRSNGERLLRVLSSPRCRHRS
jgi:hypothetical protein